MAKDLIEHKGFRSKWILYSAFHKNLRLTTTSRAMEWLDVMLQIVSPDNLQKYLLKISLEETRSINLLKSLQDKKLDIFQKTYEFIITQKKWHQKSLQDSLINDWYESYLTTLMLIKLNIRPNTLNPADLNINHKYLHYWYYKLSKTDDSEFWFAVSNLKNDQLKEFLSYKPSGSYARMFAADLATGMDSLDEKRELQIHKKSSHIKVPFLEEFYYDVHTSKGKKETLANLDLIIINQHKSPDLRLSGCVAAVYFRCRASGQYGDIVNSSNKLVAWNQVQMSPIEYAKAIKLDQVYYPQIFKN